MKISLVGPCSPEDLAHLFYKEDSVRAKKFSGYRGMPVSLLAEALIMAGHEVSVVTTASNPIMGSTFFLGDRIEVHVIYSRMRARDLALTFFKPERKLLSKKIIEINPDIVHAHWTYEFALAALDTNKPVLVTAHDSPLTIFRYMFDPYRFFRLMLAYLARFRIKNLTVVSPYLLQKWRTEMFWLRSAAVIPNISPFLVAPIKRYSKNSIKILVISDNVKHKNVKNMLLAWPIVLDQLPNAQLDLVGYGLGKDEEMHQWAKAENLDDFVSWHGYTNRQTISNLLSDADILVQPSLEESFGLTLAEAMSRGIPVIGGVHSGAVPYVVGDAGLLVNVRKPREIAAAIIYLSKDPNIRQAFGIKGQERVQNEFSAQKIVKQYIHEYERIICKEKRRI